MKLLKVNKNKQNFQNNKKYAKNESLFLQGKISIKIFLNT